MRKLQAHLSDLYCTVEDVLRYLQVKDRLSRFEESAGKEMDKERARSLADMIEHMLISEKV